MLSATQVIRKFIEKSYVSRGNIEKPGELSNSDLGLIFRINRILAINIAHILSRTFLTANLCTIFSHLAQILGIFCFFFIDFHFVVLGLFFYWVGGVLDLVDGNLSRLNGTQSMAGDYLDKIGMFFTAPLFFVSPAIGLYFFGGDIVYLYFALIICFFSSQDSICILLRGLKNNLEPGIKQIPNNQKRTIFFIRKMLSLPYHLKSIILFIFSFLGHLDMFVFLFCLVFPVRYVGNLYLFLRQYKFF